MSDCLFCKIINKEIPATYIYEDDHVVGFKDLHPQADIHHLFIHKEHTSNANQMAEEKGEHLGHIFQAIAKFTAGEKLDQSGFRVVTNVGPNAGQTVFHTHFHLVGGEPLGRFGR